MKVVIIGGGIAGLTAGILLNRKGIEVVINERENSVPARGNAFLMHAEADQILQDLTDDFRLGKIPGKLIDRFCLRRPDNRVVKLQKMDPWHCIRRKEIVELLYSLYPSGEIRHGRSFSHFEYEGEKAVAAVFMNGDVETGDLFIGADGGGSLVRDTLFGKTAFSPTEIKEVLGEVRSEEICRSLDHTFTKFQSDSAGLAFGVIPTSSDQVVWYMQYDCRKQDVADLLPETIRAFCMKMLKDFPPLVQEVIRADTFQNTYIWNTRDFDLLPTFHKGNVVLAGDSAHLALPFTSAGTTNAFVDASLIASLIGNGADLEKQFSIYYRSRSVRVLEQVELGRALKTTFLNPQDLDEDFVPVPLVGKPGNKVEQVPEEKKLNITYFTDPICSTCWAIQPQLRKLQLEYGHYLSVEYRMGGLLPSWDNYNRHGLTTPTEVAKHWQEVCESHEMPINNEIWLEDPLPSSYPPSIAFKAAQLQDTALAIVFLRRIREMLFIEKKNIIEERYLTEAAFEVGLDTARLMRDLKSKAVDHFREDLMLTHELGITMLPTILIKDDERRLVKIEGFQTYELMVERIRSLVPDIEPRPYGHRPRELFAEFNTLTMKEFTFLSDISEEYAVQILRELEELKLIKRFKSQAGDIWLNNFDSMDAFK